MQKRLQIGVSGRVDRTLAFQELCADTGGLDNERTMSDADAADYRRGGDLVLAEPSLAVISERTVGHHVSVILRKLDVHTRGEASAKAVRFGLTAAPPTA
jgi:hypothetical protein